MEAGVSVSAEKESVKMGKKFSYRQCYFRKDGVLRLWRRSGWTEARCAFDGERTRCCMDDCPLMVISSLSPSKAELTVCNGVTYELLTPKDVLEDGEQQEG